MPNYQTQTQKTQNIIILHGWGSSAEKWQSIKSLLNQYYEKTSRSIKIATPDLPGFKKETALSQIWNLDNYINWFKNLFSKQGNCLTKLSNKLSNKSVLIGHSFGGRMAIKFAAQNPEKLKALILISSAGIKEQIKTDGERVSVSLTENGSPSVFALAKVGKRFSFLPFYSFFRKFFYRYVLRKTDYINAEKFPFLKETFKNIISEDLTPYLEKIKVPTLIIWGDKDKMTPISDAYLMNKKIPNSKLEILKNIGHAPHLECPEVLAKKIHKFII